jgi:hypothetical protein
MICFSRQPENYLGLPNSVSCNLYQQRYRLLAMKQIGSLVIGITIALSTVALAKSILQYHLKSASLPGG